MRKIVSFLSLILLGTTVYYAQVGVNTDSPQASLDISAKTTDGSKPEGVLAPRLTGDQIQLADGQYNATQRGMIIYATNPTTAPAGKTINITAAGYYYFDGLVWQKMGIGAYAGSASVALNGNSFQRAALTGDATATANSNTVTVTGLQGTSVSSSAPTTNDLLSYNGSNWTPLPTSALGIPKQVVSVAVPGTQNIVTGSIVQFTVKNYDPNNAWVNNEYIVPTGLNGTYNLNIQLSNQHTASGQTTFWVMIHVEKSTDGGASYTRVASEIRTSAGPDFDNSIGMFWTGNMNVGDRLRTTIRSSADTNNLISQGNLALTKL